MTSIRWGSLLVIMAALSPVAYGQTANPAPQPPLAGVEQSGGIHEGDNVNGNQNKIVITGPVILLDSPGPRPSEARRQPPRKTSSNRVRAKVAPHSEQDLLPGPQECPLWNADDFTDVYPSEDVLSFSGEGMAEHLPLTSGSVTLTVTPRNFDHESRCAQAVKRSCLEYSVATADRLQHVERWWTEEWEDQEKKGLLENTTRTAQIVRCFADDHPSPGRPADRQSARLWSNRLSTLVSLLEQPTAAVARDAPLYRLYEKTLIRWAHLELYHSMIEHDVDTEQKAADLFARVATVNPEATWALEAAVWLFTREGHYKRAAMEQKELVNAISRSNVEDIGLAAVRPELVAATFDLVELCYMAGEYDQALTLAEDLSDRLESTQANNRLNRDTQRAIARALIGKILSLQKRWTEASRFYEAAADIGAASADLRARRQSDLDALEARRHAEMLASLGIDGTAVDPREFSPAHLPEEATTDAEETGVLIWRRGQLPLPTERHVNIHGWLFSAASLAYLGRDAARIQRLDARIQDSLSVRDNQRHQPTWSEWRYLMTRWQSLTLLGREKEIPTAGAEADQVLNALLGRPVGSSSGIIWIKFTSMPGPQVSSEVPTLAALPSAYPFSGGHFPPTSFLQRGQDLKAASAPLLFRSVLEYVALAHRPVASAADLTNAASAYAWAAEAAAELTQRIPNAGAYLEVAVLRGEARFLDLHQLDPVRAVALSQRADSIEIENTCDPELKSLYHSRRDLHTASHTITEQVRFGPVPLGEVSLVCPFESNVRP